ncbi:uncharacterized protein LOC122710371 isoform X2 [Apis laboriosa]|uniref:uncharacterized protein LOC122710371 isoform X2 n=1 Tax=Apis laboriosa TaxID=183418 RepID=UPI001CC35FEB|nr:uncharacterized protein LOC122710371 isoform X2 [Apis laboriosa]
MVILHDEAYYESRIPQPDLGPFRNFLRFLWDREKKAFLDRTAKEWGQLGLFYLCFFTILGTIFAVQMKISIDYVSQLDKPFFQYLSSKSGKPSRFTRSTFGSPGIVFKPNSMSIASPIISVSNLTGNTKSERYVQAINDFLQEYNKNKSNYDLDCYKKHSISKHHRKSCYFNIHNLGICSTPPYGYTKPLKPCVLIKFNKRFDWIPEYYNYSSYLPHNMPARLKKVVQKSHKPYIWLSCNGANNVDKDHIGEIEYIPTPGFPVEYFPFTGQLDYMSPIVALKFNSLTLNRLVTVECYLWAQNIEQHSRYSLDFQIIIAITGAFYTCFFSALALLFAVCMKGLLATLNYEKPRWILEESLIGTNPGLGFRPMSNNADERSLIWYSSSDPSSVQKWTGLLDTFLEEYINSSLLPNGGRNQQICNYNTPVKPGHVCAVEVNNWGPCSPNHQYGFNNSAPCIFIKLNRIYGWIPEYYNDTENLPNEMPPDLVEHIKSTNSSWLNTVWVSCKGANPHDNEDIGELNYYPENHGFPGYYYPYQNIPGYLSPVVAVHFLRPARNKIINVECRAWAKNIKYETSQNQQHGMVHFELMIDE